jgi:putative ABC transport system substrate-binding protein
MNRQAFLSALGAIGLGLAAAGSARAQPVDRARRVGLLLLGTGDAPSQALVSVFRERLQRRGWTAERQLQIDVHWAGGDAGRADGELVRSAPDVVVAQGTVGIHAALEAMKVGQRTIPTVFVQLADPVAAKVVTSLERPGGHVTGVANFPASINGDRVRVLKDIAPQLGRVLLVHDRGYPTPPAFARAVEAAAASLALELRDAGARDAAELEERIREGARGHSAGLVVFPSPFTVAQAERIAGLAAELRLPAIYPLPEYAAAGGLIAYGVDTPGMWEETARLVDDLLRGADPATMPVHVPTSVHIVVNARAAKALGLALPQALLARAAKGIE